MLPCLAMYAGLLRLAAALLRSRAASAWVPAMIAAAVAMELAGPAAIEARPMFALLAVALGWCGLGELLRPRSAPAGRPHGVARTGGFAAKAPART